jgi:hypothetical protein
MDSGSISNTDYTQAIDPNAHFQKWASKKLHARGDYVSISDEGRAKAEELVNASVAAKQKLPGMEDAEDVQATNTAEGTDSASALNKSPEEQATDLEGKIKALMDQLMNIMQGPLQPQEKMQQAQPIQQQISQLQTQLNELKIQILKEKQT